MSKLDADGVPYTVCVATVDRSEHEGPVLFHNDAWIAVRVDDDADPTWIASHHVVSIRVVTE